MYTVSHALETKDLDESTINPIYEYLPFNDSSPCLRGELVAIFTSVFICRMWKTCFYYARKVVPYTALQCFASVIRTGETLLFLNGNVYKLFLRLVFPFDILKHKQNIVITKLLQQI